MSRVFIDNASESSHEQMVRKTADGRLYHQPSDRDSEEILDTMVDILVRSILPPLEEIPEAPSEDRIKAAAKHRARQYLDSWVNTGVIDKLFWKIEPVEGYTWSEMVEIVDVDEENGEVTMEDHITQSQWTETMEEAEQKLESVRSRAHDLIYDIVAGQYFTLDPEEVQTLLHDAEGIDSDGNMIENMHIQRIYVADEEQVPDAYDVQEDENGDLYYERDDSEFIDSGRVSQEYEKADDGPCWDGYEMVGMKIDENGNEVPNCVPIDEKADQPSRKRRVYVSDPAQVPIEAQIQEGPRGGFYYDTEDMPGPGYEGGTMEEAMQMASETVDVPDQEALEWVADLAVEFGEVGGMPRGDFQGIVEAYNMGKPISERLDFGEVDDFVYGYYQQNNPEFKSRRKNKRRVYITDPSEAPDNVDVEEGPRGGMYYETGGGGEQSTFGIGEKPPGYLGGPGNPIPDTVSDIEADLPTDDFVNYGDADAAVYGGHYVQYDENGGYFETIETHPVVELFRDDEIEENPNLDRDSHFITEAYIDMDDIFENPDDLSAGLTEEAERYATNFSRGSEDPLAFAVENPALIASELSRHYGGDTSVDSGNYDRIMSRLGVDTSVSG